MRGLHLPCLLAFLAAIIAPAVAAGDATVPPSKPPAAEDRDRDGVPDREDQCPDVPEDRDGDEDEDGCPEQKINVIEGRAQVTTVVYFPRERQVALSPEGIRLLDEVVAALAPHTGIEQLEVRGHTDSRGSSQYTQSVALRRAEVVRRHLVERGIAPERLVARSYGETMPIADNLTAEGRARNRRVDFQVLRAR